MKTHHKAKSLISWFRCLGIVITAFFALKSSGQGIPEPSLVFYGLVRNSADANAPLKAGSLTWKFYRSGALISTLTASLTNINDQFSYVLRVPCETEVFGATISSNTLRLTTTPTTYDRSTVSIDGYPATLFNPAQGSVNLTSFDRGKLERVDLQVGIQYEDSDNDGLPDYWEWHFLLTTEFGPGDDTDGDGVSNGNEYRAGTDPSDPNSLFKFITWQAEPQGGLRVKWASAEGRIYTLQRSADPAFGFTNLVTNIFGSKDATEYLDPTASAQTFYRVRLQP